MLLSINEAKVAELLQSNDKPYAAVFTSDVPMASENYSPAYPATYEVSGTVYAAPLLVTPETQEQFATLRHQIETSNVPLKGAEELAREVDEMRGKR
jgi:hypothetical protein